MKTLDQAVKTIGNGVLAVQSDVANPTDLDKLYATVSKKVGKIDVLFVSAKAWGLSLGTGPRDRPSLD